MFSFAANLGHIQMSPKVPNRPIYCLPLHMAVGLPSTPLHSPAPPPLFSVALHQVTPSFSMALPLFSPVHVVLDVHFALVPHSRRRGSCRRQWLGANLESTLGEPGLPANSLWRVIPGPLITVSNPRSETGRSSIVGPRRAILSQRRAGPLSSIRCKQVLCRHTAEAGQVCLPGHSRPTACPQPT